MVKRELKQSVERINTKHVVDLYMKMQTLIQLIATDLESCLTNINVLSINQYTVLEFQLLSVKCAVVTKLHKNFEQLFISIQVTQGDHSVWMLTTTSKSFQMCFYCIYLFKL